MPLELNWNRGVYRVSDPHSDFGGFVEHRWNGGRKLHEGFIASVGRTTHDPDRHWLVIGDFQTLYAAQLAVEKHMIWRGRRAT
jgi:hypothetical protein